VPAFRVLATLLLVGGLSAAALLVPIDYDLLGTYGYPGVFAVTLITTGALVLPVPYLAVIFRAASVLDPLTVALVAGVAAAIGELTGYLLGASGRQLLKPGRAQRIADDWMRRYGFISVVVLSLLPNPFFDAVGVSAGALRYPAWRFALACFLGKTGKFLVVAYFGAHLLG
jgi:membrane protein YqaA with SNARE-associated domain